MNNTCCAATPFGTCCGACDNGHAAPTPPTTSTSSSGSTYEPRSDSSIGSPHTAFRSPDARQGNLDEWTASDNATLRRETRHFLRWAKKQKLTTLDAPAVRWDGPCGVIDTEARWDQARRLLHDDTIKPEDRLAGLLVLLYAQWPAAISRLTIDHIRTSAGQVLIRLGDEPVVLPEPVAALALTVVANRRGKAAVGDPGTSPWLFPGGQPGRPISPYALTERLRQLGLQPARDRSTALFQLATDLPAAVLARMLGIHITVAVAWQRASAGDWTDYAAEISRRTYR